MSPELYYLSYLSEKLNDKWYNIYKELNIRKSNIFSIALLIL